MNNTIKNQTKAGDALPPLSYSWNGKCTCCSTACSTWRLECLGLCSLEERRNRADIIDVFKMAKGSSAFPLECIFQLSTTKHLRGHNFKLVKHRSNLELRRNFFTERLINRWNSLDQQSLDVDSVNCFKNHLQRLRNTRMGFFVD